MAHADPGPWALAGLVLALAMAAPALGLPLLDAPPGPACVPFRLGPPACAAARQQTDPLYRSWATDVAASPDGARVYVTGRYLDGANLLDYLTVAFDAASGAEVWRARYDGPPGWEDWAVKLAASPDGAVVAVTGWSRDVLATDVATVAYDAATGELLWVQRFHGPRSLASWTVGQGIAISPDSATTYITGLSLPPGTVAHAVAFDFTTIAYDTRTGDQRWLALYNGTGNSEDWGYAVAVSPDGAHVYATGRSFSGTGKKWDYATVSYDARNGDEEWAARYDGPGSFPVSVPYGITVEEWANALAVSPDGTLVYSTGRSYADESNYDFVTLAYDTATAELAWVGRYNGPGNLEDGAYDVETHPDGSLVYAAGWSASDDADMNFDFATVAHDARTGEAVWVSRYDTGEVFDDLATSLAVDPLGARVYTAGWSTTDEASHGYATVAYDARTGGELWVARAPARLANNFDFATRSNGPGNNLDLASVAASPDGSRVFLAGTSDGEAGDNDVLVVAYDARTGAELWSSLGDRTPQTTPGQAPPGAAPEEPEEPAQAPARAPVPAPAAGLLLAAAGALALALRRR